MTTSFTPSYSLNIQTGTGSGFSVSQAYVLEFPGREERSVSFQLNAQFPVPDDDAFMQLSLSYSQKISEQFRGTCTASQNTREVSKGPFFWEDRSISVGISRESATKSSTPFSVIWTHIFPKNK